ncbi:alpha/beta hydrolase domain-containing protein [Streptomyces fulvoviolaceus]|uniref:alpha/beta hydrolase domain-containing protein n=1 Tax=Streptomyces fulvoviolaceus TaxID=285535 RepID=UPI0004C4C872|nr:alpha/beta hydrolase domain-containing protein [Streptomyces fulvoviolaceus]
MIRRRTLLLLGLGTTVALPTTAPAVASVDDGRSGITAVKVTRRDSLGMFGGTPYERLAGTLSGTVAKDEPVAGIDIVTGDDGVFAYTSGFELIRPIGQDARGEVVVEAENRGNPLMLRDFNGFDVPGGAPQDVSYSPGLGNGFLFEGGRSYARVQWQTGFSPGVPEAAQGVGQVIVRDFGRLLRDGRLGDADSPLGSYRHRLLVGLSQAAWFVTSFVAEGFNEARGQVFQGAYAQDGVGNQLAVNAVAAADGEPQTAYVRPDGIPLTPRQVLRRPKSDPVFVDVAAYTDYYRLRASVSRQEDATNGYHRYDWPAAHRPTLTKAQADSAFAQGCNDGEVIPLNAIDNRPYARALLVALERGLGIGGPPAPMPRERLFTAGAKPADPALLNGLPGREVSVPQVDTDGFPLGGVRFPAAALPLGSPVPPALTPVSTASITATCGNSGGWHPFTADELLERYGSLDHYLAAYDTLAARLVTQRLLLDSDRQPLLDQAAAEWSKAPAQS